MAVRALLEDYDHFSLAEAIPGATTDLFSNLAAELGVVIIASLFEKRAQGLYHNTTAVIDADGSYLGKYRKMHIPDDPSFYEKFYFTPGDLGYKVFKTKFATFGVLICWDQWYPEADIPTKMQELIVATGKNNKVTVNPRYGVWNPETAEVTAAVSDVVSPSATN